MASVLFQASRSTWYQSSLRVKSDNKGAFKPLLTFSQESVPNESFVLPGGKKVFAQIKRLTTSDTFQPWLDAPLIDAYNLKKSSQIENQTLVVFFAGVKFGRYNTLNGTSGVQFNANLGYTVQFYTGNTTPIVTYFISYLRINGTTTTSTPVGTQSYLPINDNTPGAWFDGLTQVLNLMITQMAGGFSMTLTGIPTLTFTLQPISNLDKNSAYLYHFDICEALPLYNFYEQSQRIAVGVASANPVISVTSTYGQVFYAWVNTGNGEFALDDGRLLTPLTSMERTTTYEIAGAQVCLSILGLSITYNNVSLTTVNNIRIGNYLNASTNMTGTKSLIVPLGNANYYGDFTQMYIYCNFIASGVYAGQVVNSMPQILNVNLARLYEYNYSSNYQIWGQIQIQGPPSSELIQYEASAVNLYEASPLNPQRYYKSLFFNTLSVKGLEFPIFYGDAELEICFVDASVPSSQAAIYDYK